MQGELDPTERRIVGVLVEKEFTTPDRYPMTVNSLTSGCNQKSNRDPVLTLADFEVEGALRNLFVRGWVTNVTDGGRMVKWKHRMRDKLDVDEPQAAVLAELLLRGHQQPGELRARAHRMRSIPALSDLMEILESLASRLPPLVTCLGRRDGERASRYGQTLAGDDAAEGPSAPSTPDPPFEPSPSEPVAPSSAATVDGAGPSEEDRVAQLEHRVLELEKIVAHLRDQLGDV